MLALPVDIDCLTVQDKYKTEEEQHSELAVSPYVGMLPTAVLSLGILVGV